MNCAYADETSSSDESFWQGVGRDFVSPVTTPARTFFWAGVGATLIFVAAEDRVSDPIQNDVAKRKPLGANSKYGDYAGRLIPNALYVVGMWADSYWGGRPKSRARAILMLKSSIYSGVVADAIKYVVREPRPDNSDRYSFPSGHATSAFAFASVIGAEHEWYYGAAAYALAGFVAFSRMNDNRHYLHDVIAGGVLGASYGLGLYYRSHDAHSTSDAKPTSTVWIAPSDDNFNGALVGLYREF